jgi:hypothetical protein
MRHSIVIAAMLGSAIARADELAMKDLQALASQGNWRELLATADQFKPSSRDADWRKLVTSAGSHVVGKIADASSNLDSARDLLDVVPVAEAKYGFLRDDHGYLEAKARGVQRVAAGCSEGAQAACAAVVLVLASGIESYPKGTAHQLALLVDHNVGPAEALHFWRLAVGEEPKLCEDARVEHAVIRVLGSNTSGAPLDETLTTARACLARLEAGLTQALIDAEEGSAFAKNACPLLKSRPGAGIAKKKKCH